MKAAFVLTPAESKRLIAKAVVELEEVKRAREEGYIIIAGGTTNAYVAQELLGRGFEPQRFTAGIITQGIMCVTDPQQRYRLPIILHRGKEVRTKLRELLMETPQPLVMIKGANAVDPEGNVGILTGYPDGGTIGASLAPLTYMGVSYIVPVGLEKLVPSVKEAARFMGAQGLDYSLGPYCGMFCLTGARVITEIEAFKVLADVEAKHIASGGVGGSEGSVLIGVSGDEPQVHRAIGLVESVKGESPIPPLRWTCEGCTFECPFQGLKGDLLPEYLR